MRAELGDWPDRDLFWRGLRVGLALSVAIVVVCELVFLLGWIAVDPRQYLP